VRNQNLTRPIAIAMWDFSWLERRWPGAGYENWSVALDELVERGYDAVRIDAYPTSSPPTRTRSGNCSRCGTSRCGAARRAPWCGCSRR
jgi:hypothetical protein